MVYVSVQSGMLINLGMKMCDILLSAHGITLAPSLHDKATLSIVCMLCQD